MEGDANGPTRLNQLPIRWLMLALQCLALMGSYYCYDNPAATLNQMQTYFNVSTNGSSNSAASNKFNFNFNLLYSVYSFPNMVLPFFGGYFCDKLGIRMMAVVFNGFITLGQAIFAIGMTLSDPSMRWPVMYVGRIIFGFGGESLSVAQSAIIAKWFVGKELALALGVNLALARVGSVINDVASEKIAETKVYYALWVGFFVCIASLASTIWCFFIDRTAEKRILANQHARGAITGLPVPEKEEINLWAVRSFPAIFWILTGSCITVYCAVLPFNNIASSFIVEKWLIPTKDGQRVPEGSLPQSQQNSLDGKANLIMMITYLTAGCISPILGGVIDRVGRRGIMNLISAVLVVVVHILLRNTDMYPIFPLVLLGFCYSIYASALWPSIALVIAKESVATAYGVVTAVQNIGLGFAPMIVGALQPAAHDVSKGAYDKVELFFIILGACGILFGLWLNYEDRMRPYPVLNMPEAKIAELVEQIGDLGKLASRRPKKGELADTEALTQSLLDPLATPTFYEPSGGVITIEEVSDRTKKRHHSKDYGSVNGEDAEHGHRKSF